MKRIAGLSLLAGVLFAWMAVSGSPQAAPFAANICKVAPVTQCSKIVSDGQNATSNGNGGAFERRWWG